MRLSDSRSPAACWPVTGLSGSKQQAPHFSLHLGLPLDVRPNPLVPPRPTAPAPAHHGRRPPDALDLLQLARRLGQGGCRGQGPCGHRTQGRPAGRSQALGEGPGLGLSPYQVRGHTLSRGHSPEPGRPGVSLQGPGPGASHTRSEGASGSARPPSAVCSLPAGCRGLTTSPLAGARQQHGSGSQGPIHSGECPMGFCSGPRARVLGNPLGSPSPAQMPRPELLRSNTAEVSRQLEGDGKRSQPVLLPITNQERPTQVI